MCCNHGGLLMWNLCRKCFIWIAKLAKQNRIGVNVIERSVLNAIKEGSNVNESQLQKEAFAHSSVQSLWLSATEEGFKPRQRMEEWRNAREVPSRTLRWVADLQVRTKNPFGNFDHGSNFNMILFSFLFSSQRKKKLSLIRRSCGISSLWWKE